MDVTGTRVISIGVQGSLDPGRVHQLLTVIWPYVKSSHYVKSIKILRDELVLEVDEAKAGDEPEIQRTIRGALRSLG